MELASPDHLFYAPRLHVFLHAEENGEAENRTYNRVGKEYSNIIQHNENKEFLYRDGGCTGC